MRYIVIFFALMTCLTGCKTRSSCENYASEDFGEATRTYAAVVKQMREVTITNEKGLQNNTAGIIGGGLAGALLGSTVGHGSGTVVAEVAGGLAGATGGAALEQSLETQKAMEYTVELDNGEMRTVVQGFEPRLHEGQKVYIMIAEKGRSRIIPR